MKKQFHFLTKQYCWLLLTLVFFACRKQPAPTPLPVAPPITSVVPFELAKQIAEKRGLTSISLHSASRTSNSKARRIQSSQNIAKDGQPAVYVFNYEGGGWVLLSADRNELPILAFSDQGSFDAEHLPPGPDAWLYTVTEYMGALRKDPSLQHPSSREAWSELLTNAGIEERHVLTSLIPIDWDWCNKIDPVVKGPLLSTAWGQVGKGYDDFSPMINNTRAPAGCVATAMAQIMKYHRHPKTFNWNAMPNKEGSTETARLIRAAGRSVNMEYGANGSGANTKDARNALVNHFGYASSMRYVDFHMDVIRTELSWGRPVLLKGGKNTGGFLGLFTSYDGHAWVCDGYRFHYTCMGSYLSLHMNWGWGGKANGDYSIRGFNPYPNQSYNEDRMMIIGIEPR